MLNATRGRPKRYENQAEKQKAYRERHKAQPPALRKSPAEIWREKEAELEVEYNRHQNRFQHMDYDDWRKEHQRIYAACCEAGTRAYYLKCYETGWFPSSLARNHYMPLIPLWLAELDN